MSCLNSYTQSFQNRVVCTLRSIKCCYSYSFPIYFQVQVTRFLVTSAPQQEGVYWNVFLFTIFSGDISLRINTFLERNTKNRASTGNYSHGQQLRYPITFTVHFKLNQGITIQIISFNLAESQSHDSVHCHHFHYTTTDF